MSVADEQMPRGEYNDAAKTYRKVYNKLTKKEEAQYSDLLALMHDMIKAKMNNKRAEYEEIVEQIHEVSGKEE